MAKATPEKSIQNFIREIRGQRVILDSDLAALYGVTTTRLMEQFRRNKKRFPEDFAYLHTNKEVTDLMSQNATSSLMKTSNLKTHGGRRKPGIVFTEHGAIMAATILNSEEAVAMSIFVVRAFVKMREVASQTVQWMKKLREVELALSKRMDGHEVALNEIFMELEKLMEPSFPVPEKRRIGFRLTED